MSPASAYCTASLVTYTTNVKLWRDRSGQGILEFGLVVGLVAMVVIGTLLVLGNNSEMTLARAGHAMDTASGPAMSTAARPAARP
jgi:Flp pilus assembly pilin Flp